MTAGIRIAFLHAFWQVHQDKQKCFS